MVDDVRCKKGVSPKTGNESTDLTICGPLVTFGSHSSEVLAGSGGGTELRWQWAEWRSEKEETGLVCLCSSSWGNPVQ